MKAQRSSDLYFKLCCVELVFMRCLKQTQTMQILWNIMEIKWEKAAKGFVMDGRASYLSNKIAVLIRLLKLGEGFHNQLKSF